MPLIKSSSKKAFSNNVSEMVKAGHPQKNALAAAYATARKAGAKYASGGMTAPWYERQASRNMTHGFLKSSVPGRTDKLPMNVPSGSFVVPADVVSHMGQNNSMAGAKRLSNMITGGALGMGRRPRKFAKGGAVEPVPIIAAGGEYVIHPHHVKQIGGGHIDRGHDWLDKWVVDQRKQHIKTLKKLPGPKGANEYADGGPVTSTDISDVNLDNDAWGKAARLAQQMVSQPQREGSMPSSPLAGIGQAGDTLRNGAVADFGKSIPRGLLTGLANAASASGQGGMLEMGHPPDSIPSGHEAAALLERHTTGPLPTPQGRAGRYGATLGEILGNPANWMGPGSAPYKGAWNLASALASETAGQATEGTPHEPYARAVASWSPMAAERLYALAPKAMPTGALGIFGGRSAVTADHQALNRAQDMAKSGASKDSIWKETGWFAGADGKWRFEIPDNSLRVRQGYGDDLQKGAISHESLLAAYPEIGERGALSHRVTIGESDGPRGSYGGNNDVMLEASGGNKLEARSAAAHELQHRIQDLEGHSPGSTPFLESGDTWGEAFRNYYNRPGEVEARNVQRRLGMNEAQRRRVPPWQSERWPDVYE